MRVSVRPATAKDLPALTIRLAGTDLEEVDLAKSIVYVAESSGEIVGVIAAQLGWRVEPLHLFSEFRKHAPHMSRRRVTYLLGKAIDDYILGEKNLTGIRAYWAFISDGVFAALAEHFGLERVFKDGRIYRRVGGESAAKGA